MFRATARMVRKKKTRFMEGVEDADLVDLGKRDWKILCRPETGFKH